MDPILMPYGLVQQPAWSPILPSQRIESCAWLLARRGVERGCMCPDKHISAVVTPVWHMLPGKGFSPHGIQSPAHTQHGTSFQTLQQLMTHLSLSPFQLIPTHIRFLCCFFFLLFINISLKLECRTSSPICTDSKFPDPTSSSKTGLVSSSIIISDSPKEIT